MERVVTINLNGNPYQLDDPAYDALRAYRGRAEAALADNPDKAEIVRDLEQAIADKCMGYLSPHKTVVSASEMAPYLGLCLGLQVMVVELARAHLDTQDVNSTEFDRSTPYPVIDLLPD